MPGALHSEMRFVLLSLVVVACGSSERGRNDFGNPEMEEQKARCMLAGGTEVTLYEGNGGATTSLWWSVAATPPGRPERQIFYTYAYPEITGIECGADNMLAIRVDGVAPEILRESEIATRVEQPSRGYYKGKREPSRGLPFRR